MVLSATVLQDLPVPWGWDLSLETVPRSKPAEGGTHWGTLLCVKAIKLLAEILYVPLSAEGQTRWLYYNETENSMLLCELKLMQEIASSE